MITRYPISYKQMKQFLARLESNYPFNRKPRAGDVLRDVGEGGAGIRGDTPLRSEILTRDGLIRRAQILAGEHKVTRSRQGWSRIRNRFEENFDLLERTYYLLAGAARDGEMITPGGEWLLDNYHVIEQNVREIRTLLPKGYYGSLPKLTDGDHKGLPRVYSLALDLLSHTDAVVDGDLLSSFIYSYQEAQVLTIGELWAFPIMLRIALLENLRRLAVTALKAKEAENEAELVAKKILDNTKLNGTDILLDLAARIKALRRVSPSFAAHLVRRLRVVGPRCNLALKWFEEWLSENIHPADELIRNEQYSQATNQISIGNSFGSLKTILSMSWPEWFEMNSKVDYVLRSDPAHIYSRSDFATRNHCRSRIEEYSRRLNISEVEVATKVVEIAKKAEEKEGENSNSSEDQYSAESSLRFRHVGYYLIDKGRSELDLFLGVVPKFRERCARYLIQSKPLALYLGLISFFTLIFSCTAFFVFKGYDFPPFVLITIVALLLFPASSFALNLVNWIITTLLPPKVLPKLDFRDGIPSDCRTVVAVHSILRESEVIEKSVEFLEVRFLANNDQNLSFAFLADLAESDTQELSSDRELIEFAAAKIEQLNSKYCKDTAKRFYFITRDRTWNESQKEFLCWERKRGKLDQFNQLLLGEQPQCMRVVVGEVKELQQYRYVITLDADTHLPRDSAQKLVATINHPLNHPVFNTTTRMVVDGYSIIQPRIGSSLTSAQTSFFSRIFAGQAGLDPYTTAVSDLYQDLFGEGSYIGKAIYDVRVFSLALNNRVPENALLSHDLFEGLFTRVGLAVDIELIDHFPSRFNVYARRLHRWVRGDWQLLPWLFGKIPDSKRNFYSSPLNGLSKWKIVDNLRRSMVEPALFLFFLLILTFYSEAAVAATICSFILLSFPLFSLIFDRVILNPITLFKEGVVSALGQDLIKELNQIMLNFVFLPYKAYLMVHAIVVTLYRLYLSKENLLEWETAHQSELRLGNSFRCYWKEMGWVTIAIVAVAIIANVNSTSESLFTYPVFLLWIFAPFIAFIIGRTGSTQQYNLKHEDRQRLNKIAEETWQFFQKYLNQECNYLIPDNIQLVPKKTIAYRTSPTNISLSLLSVLSACDLGFIKQREMILLLKQILLNVDTLEKHNGHLYNWYEIRTKDPLKPRYISTVDSGNFVAHLIALKSALVEIGNGINYDLQTEDSVLRGQVGELVLLCDKLIDNTDFSFLYNERKKLFYIGYNVDEARFDNYFYDLLASEARLASFVAIANKSVPQEHWFSLGRNLTNSPGGRALLSWTGTMFEYLMPLLVMKNFGDTILSSTYKSVVKAQIRYGAKRQIPWGVSESGYGGVDFEQTYQYRAFGVPGLGLKRGLSDDLVISPYSTFLALMINPEASLLNISALEKAGMRGEYGFYEAIDYTPERLSQDESGHVVRSYLAHHQGMTLVALNNVLLNGLMQERFHNDPLIRSTELLIQERIPKSVTVFLPHQAELSYLERQEASQKERVGEVLNSPYTRVPRTHVLANEQYSIMLDNGGSGYSRFKGDIALTRWREDPLNNHYGTYVYVRDLKSKHLWSTTYMPTKVSPDHYEVIFNPEKVEYKRRDFDIGLHTEVTISPEDNVEVRKITVTNFSNYRRSLEFTTYAEVALGHHAADVAHPAFNKMFIQSEFIEDIDALLFTRRPRSPHEEGLSLLHQLTMNVCWSKTQFETARVNFIGRGHSVYNPLIFSDDSPLSGTVGPVIDPVFSLRTRVEIEPGTSETLTFVTAAARNRAEALFLGQLYHDSHSVQRAFEMAWSKSNVELRHEQISVGQSHTFQRIANALFFQIDSLRGNGNHLSQNRLLQSGLWRFGISGDLPIVLLRVDDESQIKQVSEILLAHQYLKHRHIDFDLVILNDYAEGYFQNFHDSLDQLVRSGYPAQHLDKRGGIFLRTPQQLSAEERTLLFTVARVVFIAEKGSLSKQLSILDEIDKDSPEKSGILDLIFKEGRDTNVRIKTATKESNTNVPVPQELSFFNGYGGFSAGGKSYFIKYSQGHFTPLPWINVIANPNFGFLTSESGAGYTWSENSRENRLTPWHNDPVSDPVSEAIYIRDAANGAYWSATPQPCSIDESFDIEHSFGYSTFKSEQRDISTDLCISGSIKDRIKFWKLKLLNNDNRPRRLELYLYVDWLLGINRHLSNPYILNSYDSRAKILTGVNHYNNEFAGRLIYIGSSAEISSYTTSRSEFLGRNNSLATPLALTQAVSNNKNIMTSSMSRLVHLSQKTGVGFESCGVIRVVVMLNPGQQKEVTFFMGEAYSIDEARKLSATYRSPVAQSQELDRVKSFWHSLTSRVTFKTPEKRFDTLMNGWLIYQCLGCRIWGRSALYQSGGAYGFRDQLQDSLSLLYLDPTYAREQILRAAARQFIEGDVQHWWHPPTGRGVRTKISDDYLWLPYAVAKYIEVTGDRTILDEEVSYIESAQLDKNQMEAYLVPHISNVRESIYAHCIRAIKYGLKFGSHGLPLIGAGDWNDGMNEVGPEGKGESVWLAWFLYDNLLKFATLAKEYGDGSSHQLFIQNATDLLKAIEDHGWDGEWYRRAYFDDGTEMGSINNSECQIDSISQSWSIISKGGDRQRSERAMNSLYNRLVDQEHKIIKLLSPPFDKSDLEPGYIKGYLPGIRENGGQYTHAACWVVIATAMLGQGGKALELWNMINPIGHTETPLGVEKYKGEPYVLCGDVYSQAPHQGRAGWSWYTGSCGWLYTAGVEYIAGLKVKSDYFTINPCIPSNWPGFEIVYKYGNVDYLVEVINPDGVESGVVSIEVNGEKVSDKKIYYDSFTGQSSIKVKVIMGTVSS